MSLPPARNRPRISRAEALHIAIMVGVGLLAGAVLLASLLHTWGDVRNTLDFALGRTALDINGRDFSEPLPPPLPGFQGPVTRPPTPVYRLEGPLPDLPANPSARNDPASGRSYDFYMQQLKKAHEYEARRRASREPGQPARDAPP
jgi:hypothetical protein